MLHFTYHFGKKEHAEWVIIHFADCFSFFAFTSSKKRQDLSLAHFLHGFSLTEKAILPADCRKNYSCFSLNLSRKKRKNYLPFLIPLGVSTRCCLRVLRRMALFAAIASAFL